jgi:cytochrome c553
MQRGIIGATGRRGRTKWIVLACAASIWLVGSTGGASSAGGDAAEAELAAALAAAGDPARGREAYLSCAVCHLENGAGRPDGTFPQLAGQHAEVITKQLVDIRSGRRANPLMQPYAERLADGQAIADVALYVSALPIPAEHGVGPATDLAHGADLYARDCARCHGARGEGDGPRLVPRLAGQHYLYLLRQIRDIGASRRHNAHPEMIELVAGYPDRDLRALVDYASRLRPTGRGSDEEEVSP